MGHLAKTLMALVVILFVSMAPLNTASLALVADVIGDAKKVNFKTQDHVNIIGVYQLPNEPIGKLPLILLIHQGGSSKEEWIRLPIWQALLKEGYALLAFDLRQHGESDVDRDDVMDLFNNPKRAPLDLLAALEFVKGDARINQNRIGVLGASVGANLAVVAACDEKYKVKSIVAMSGKVSAAQKLSGLDVPLVPQNGFYIASEHEQNGLRKKWALNWHDNTAGHKKLVIASGKEHGSSILASAHFLEQHIIDWYAKTL